MKIAKIEELTISSQYELYGNRLFFVKDNCLHSIELLSSIKKINREVVQLKPLSTLVGYKIYDILDSFKLFVIYENLFV